MAQQRPKPPRADSRRAHAAESGSTLAPPRGQSHTPRRSADPRDSRFKARAEAKANPPADGPPAAARHERPRRTAPLDRRSPNARESSRTLPDAGPDGLPNVVISRRGTERWQEGHPWIYRADLALEPALVGGEVVRVLDGRGWFLGKAYYSKASKIALRCLTLEDEPVDRAFFARRIAQADALRRRIDGAQTTYRAIHADADLLPGLVVDRFADILSAQF